MSNGQVGTMSMSERPPQSQEISSQNIIDRLSVLVEKVAHLNNRSCELRNGLTGRIDSISGCRPEQPVDPSGTKSSHDHVCMMDHLHSMVDSMSHEFNGIESQINRL